MESLACAVTGKGPVAKTCLRIQPDEFPSGSGLEFSSSRTAFCFHYRSRTYNKILRPIKKSITRHHYSIHFRAYLRAEAMIDRTLYFDTYHRYVVNTTDGEIVVAPGARFPYQTCWAQNDHRIWCRGRSPVRAWIGKTNDMA